MRTSVQETRGKSELSTCLHELDRPHNEKERRRMEKVKKLEGNGPVESAASRAIKDKHEVH